MAQQKMENTFDQLAKGLSSGEVSRGKALRLMGAALVGGVLASIPRVAAAQQVCTHSACCQCQFYSGQTLVRTKCFVLDTTSCSEARRARLAQRCNTRCEKFKAARYPELVLGVSFLECFEPTSGERPVCDQNEEPGVRGTRCENRRCTPPT